MTMVTVEPETVQTGVVVEAKLTVRPEDAVAVTVNGAPPKVTPLRGPNVIVCVPAETVKPCVTGRAAAKFALPAWLAVIEQAPTATMVTVEPDTVQTAVVVDVKETARPEDAVAVIPNGAVPNAILLRGPNVIV
jgi:hypothetical protein